MLNNKEYYKTFISQLTKDEPCEVGLASLVLPESLSDAISNTLSLAQRAKLCTKELFFNIKIEHNSITYEVFIDNSNYNSKRYTIYVDNPSYPDVFTSYCLHCLGYSDITSTCEYMFIKKNSVGLYMMTIRKSVNTPFKVQEYFYGKDTLSVIGDAYSNPYLLVEASEYSIYSDLKFPTYNPPDLKSAYQYFQARASELFSQDINKLIKKSP